MKLLIDAGNTRVKWALVKGDTWLCSDTLPVERVCELPGQCAAHLDKFKAGMIDIHQIWVSNVAGDEVAQQIRTLGDMPIRFIKAQDSQCGVSNRYMADQLGADRWAALIAAWNLKREKCIVVSCGTATTIDALSENGEFYGGLILPGVKLMTSCIVASTKQLKISCGEYAPFPMNTADALYSGAIQASCGAIERQRALLDDASAPVVLCGGAAELIRPFIAMPTRNVENLVLHGLLLIAQEANAR